ncbi:MAG TPA: DUF1540 domain-containing protein [Bacillota bacterium]|nr:DUF1540 domain-containing protein [Bacillota bacterium]HPT87156.1 DUF1540 domain-containing protein [Bacillota bacterium]
MNRINCSVSSCKYNEAGQKCNAAEIKVENNFNLSHNMEIGSLDNQNKNATTSMETCCQTFTPK